MNNDIILNIYSWVKQDWKSNPLRFFIELLAWTISIGCALIMALTVPNPPLMILYPLWILGCILYAWASYSRKSFGMLGNYLLLTSVDSIGLARLLIQ